MPLSNLLDCNHALKAAELDRPFQSQTIQEDTCDMIKKSKTEGFWSKKHGILTLLEV